MVKPLHSRFVDFFRRCNRKKKWSNLYYVVENADWSVRWDGIYITENVEKLYGLKTNVVTDHGKIRNQILHFGSRSLYVPSLWKQIDRSNRIVFTWFHGDKDDPDPGNLAMIEDISHSAETCEFLHTTNTRMAEKLVSWGVSEEKVVIIPLGVDRERFRPATPGERNELRVELGIPQESICIGSFQKDGVGWGEGIEPKMVKGPDVFCDVVVKLVKTYPVYVLLLGPARGYVKKRLNDAGIPYVHRYVKDYHEVPKYYRALDLYLVTSRNEGGPKAILESMASAVPVVTTDVGMAEEVVQHGVNGYLTPVENIDGLTRFASAILEDREKTQSITAVALETVRSYGWDEIARLYFNKIYGRLLSS